MAERIIEKPIFPKLRERVKEIRERIRIPRLRGEAGTRGEIPVGKGALIERARKRAVEVTERLQEVKPGLIPRFGEILSEWYPGKRLVTVLTPKTEIVKPGELIHQEAEKVRPPVGEGKHY